MQEVREAIQTNQGMLLQHHEQELAGVWSARRNQRIPDDEERLQGRHR